MTWVFADLSDDDLREIARGICFCLPPNVSGTRSGFTCAAHRAQVELERRAAASVPK